MRIVYLTQPYPPMVSGASIVAEQLAIGMANRGHKVLVIAASDNGHEYIVQHKNLTVLRLASFRNPLRVNQWLMLFPKKSVLQALKQFQPDIIHVHEPFQTGLLGLKYARLNQTPILLTIHQLPWFITSYLPNIPKLKKIVEKLVWKYAAWIAGKFTGIISPTKTISNVIGSHLRIKPITINYGIDRRIFNPHSCNADQVSVRLKFNIPLNVPIILHIGRLDADKRVERVILATADVIKKSKAHLLIVGDGSQRTMLVKLCKSLGVESRAHFAGFISQKCELAKIYRASNIFVTASEIETQGIVLLDAAACGLPLAAVNATCIPEVIHHGCNGYLSCPGDIESLSKSIHNILQNGELAKSMSKESCLISEKYDIETTFNEHEKLYVHLTQLIPEIEIRSRLVRFANKGNIYKN